MNSHPAIPTIVGGVQAKSATECLDPSDPAFWRARLIQRKYGEHHRAFGAREYSVRIQHDNRSWFLPLGTDDQEAAILTARDRYRAVISQGWPSVLSQFVHEFTLALFWLDNPVGCTYTTLFSMVPPCESSPSTLVRSKSSQNAVIILEPEEEIRRSIVNSIDRNHGYSCVAGYASTQDLLDDAKQPPVHLVLYNRNSSEVSLGEVQRALQRQPAMPLSVGYGIYEQSDDVFVSLTGVSGGYFLRRRPPSEILEPLQGVWRSDFPAQSQARLQIASYFYDLFRHPPAESPETASLTQREREILRCLCNGCPDKEIARALQIRASTVHTHLKHIFEKLGVHTRTEAVVRYMQK